MTKSPAAARKPRFTYTPEQIAEMKAERTALRDGVKTFEIDEDDERMTRAFERLTERYSERNSMLIIMQCPATRGDVKAKSKWAEQGLGKIRKGAHGLLILAPSTDPRKVADVEEEVKDETTGQTRKLRFVWVRVYDRSQMEAFAPKTADAPAADNALDRLLAQ